MDLILILILILMAITAVVARRRELASHKETLTSVLECGKMIGRAEEQLRQARKDAGLRDLPELSHG